MDRMMDLTENMCTDTESVAFDPTLGTGYADRKARRDAKAAKAKAAATPPPPVSEEGFTRVGPARFLKSSEETSCDITPPTVLKPIKRLNSDLRRQYRAQPTRRAVNAR